MVKAPDPSYKSSGQCQGPQLCIKEFPQRWKVVKQIKYLLKGKKSTIPVDRHTGRLRELQPCSSLYYFHGVFHMGFLWPVILNCLVHSPYLVYLRLEMASLLTQLVKNLPAMWESWAQFLSWEDTLEEGMASHSSILVWRISMDRGTWQAIVHGVEKSQPWLSD